MIAGAVVSSIRSRFTTDDHRWGCSKISRMLTRKSSLRPEPNSNWCGEVDLRYLDQAYPTISESSHHTQQRPSAWKSQSVPSLDCSLGSSANEINVWFFSFFVTSSTREGAPRKRLRPMRLVRWNGVAVRTDRELGSLQVSRFARQESLGPEVRVRWIVLVYKC